MSLTVVITGLSSVVRRVLVSTQAVSICAGAVIHAVMLRHLRRALPGLGSGINRLIRIEHYINMLSAPAIILQGRVFNCR